MLFEFFSQCSILISTNFTVSFLPGTTKQGYFKSVCVIRHVYEQSVSIQFGFNIPFLPEVLGLSVIYNLLVFVSDKICWSPVWFVELVEPLVFCCIGIHATLEFRNFSNVATCCCASSVAHLAIRL